MANVIIIGGGFSGLVAAEYFAQRLGRHHHVTLISRDDLFTFYPALVRVAFGECEPEDVTFDLRETLMDVRVRFVQGEVARVDPRRKRVVLARGEMAGEMPYDFLLYAPGRRLATEHTPGFYEHAHHLLSVDGALKFGEAVRNFEAGRIVFGNCPDSRLAVPVYEAAFAMSRLLEKRGTRARSDIKLALPATPGDLLGHANTAGPLLEALAKHDIDIELDFAPARVNKGELVAANGQTLPCDLLMLVPAFRGPSLLQGTGLTDEEGYAVVDEKLRVASAEGIYAAGDATDFPGPKMGHMAVQQGLVAATNIVAEIYGRAPDDIYHHELKMVLDEGGEDTIYMRQRLTNGEKPKVRQGLFWRWAKRAQEKIWLAQHT